VQIFIHSNYAHIDEGQFLLDALVAHLQKYNAPSVVAIAEDATRIISRVEYDGTTNHCVGFVLPTNENGLPLETNPVSMAIKEMAL
jgi:hypothetical protein